MGNDLRGCGACARARGGSRHAYLVYILNGKKQCARTTLSALSCEHKRATRKRRARPTPGNRVHSMQPHGAFRDACMRGRVLACFAHVCSGVLRCASMTLHRSGLELHCISSHRWMSSASAAGWPRVPHAACSGVRPPMRSCEHTGDSPRWRPATLFSLRSAVPAALQDCAHTIVFHPCLILLAPANPFPWCSASLTCAFAQRRTVACLIRALSSGCPISGDCVANAHQPRLHPRCDSTARVSARAREQEVGREREREQGRERGRGSQGWGASASKQRKVNE
eukprot:6210437-Pleurochrysis_carterae.AAC.3